MENITWYGNAGFSFVDKNSGNRIYYVDPFELPQTELEPADLVFITHAHPDHFSPNDLDLIMHDETTVIAPPEILLQIDRNDKYKQGVMPNNSYEVKGFKFSTIPAYNVNPDRLMFHPKENNWVGYIFELNGQKIYHAGDTDLIPEIIDLKDLHLDIAMIPMGGTYTMNVSDTIEAANAICAKVTIPMHYRRQIGEGYKEAEERFKTDVTNSKVEILEQVS